MGGIPDQVQDDKEFVRMRSPKYGRSYVKRAGGNCARLASVAKRFKVLDKSR